MAVSNSDRLMRTRKPRVHITYEVDTGGGLREKELPFVIGVMGDFSGDPTRPLTPLRERQFIKIDRDNFHDVLARMKAGLKLRVHNELAADGSEIGVDLAFQSLDDFSPDHIARQSEPLRTLVSARDRLRDLVKGLDQMSEEEFAALRNRLVNRSDKPQTPPPGNDDSGESSAC